MSRISLIVFAFIFTLNAPGQSNPVPFLNQPLLPAAITPGRPSFTLTANGTGFVSGATVNWNGSALVTTFVSASQLTANVPAADVATASTATVTVSNPVPGGGVSNVQYFEVTTPTTQLSAASFSNIGALNVSAWGTATAADFNGDGKLDAVIASYTPDNSGNVCVLLGKGDGGFQPQQCSTSAGAGWQTLVAADVNGDNKLDLIAVDTANNVTDVFLSKGDGTFQSPIPVNCCTRPAYVGVGDFNGDGKLDLVISDLGSTQSASGQLTVMLGNGDGTFASGGNYFSNAIVVGRIAVGDFNKDGKLDVAFEESDLNNNGVDSVNFLLGNGDGTFLLGTEITGFGGWGLLVADLNGDGNLDLVANNAPADANGFVSLLDVCLGNGDGTFQVPVNYGRYQGFLPGLADFNGDGLPDVLTTSSDTIGNDSWNLFLGNADGSLQPEVSLFGNVLLATIATSIGDFNNDGRPDFTASNLIVLQGSFPGATLAPTAKDFGSINVGKTTSSQFVTLTNSGNLATTISGTPISGPNASDFAISSSSCGSSLAVGASCQINMTFTPSASGLRTALLTINDNVPGNPVTATLTGTGVDYSAMSFGPNLTFTQQLVGTTSTPQAATLTNVGTLAVTITSIAVTGGNAATDFAQTNNCPSTLAANASCQVTVTFTPTTTGTRTAAVLVTDGSSDSPQGINLTGTGITSTISLSPSSLTFPNQYVGTSGLPQTVTVTNHGTVSVSITSVTASPSDFGVLNSCGSSLAVNASCSIGVFFDPTASGSRTGTLTITDSATGSPQVVGLSGTGQDFSMSAPSSSASVTAGQTANYTITISPGGGFNQSVALTCSGAPAGSMCSVSPSALTLNGTSSATAAVTVTTTPNFAALLSPPTSHSRSTIWAIYLGMSGLGSFVCFGLCTFTDQRKGWIFQRLTLLMLLAMSLVAAGCGSGSSGGGQGGAGTPPGTYTLSLTGNFSNGATLSHTTNLTLTVH
jgi:hypothetical protein